MQRAKTPESAIFTFEFNSTNPHWSDVPQHNEHFLKGMEYYFNQKLVRQGHLFLNEVLDALGIARTQEGQLFGWMAKDIPFVAFAPIVIGEGPIELTFDISKILYKI